jgi:type II secretory pathway pseudopilin PulG
MANDALVVVLIAGFLALLVFIVLREFWTWYWKQSEQVALLKDIARTLQLIEEQGRPLPPGVPPPNGSAWERPADWLPTARG